MTISPDYDAARETAACAERPGRGKIAVAGSDRRTYLHAMVTNDIATLQAGTGCYAAYLTPQGRMITDMRVFELGDLVLLDLPAAVTPAVLAKLDQFIFSEDVKLGDLTEAFAEVTIVGPKAAALVAAVIEGRAGTPAAPLTEDDLAAWPEFANTRALFRGEIVIVAATRDLGPAGFDLFIERPHAAGLLAALQAAGATVLSDATAEILRIEAGRPLFGVDMNADTIPLEAGLDQRAISFTKGCYPGQEVIIRVVHRGHGRIAKRLVGVRLAGSAVPRPGAAVTIGEREVGRITSAAPSPAAGGPIALGYVLRDLSDPGTAVTVAHEPAALAGTIAALPFTG